MASTSGSGPRTENPHPSGFAVLPVHVLLDQDLNATDVRVLLALSSFVGGPEGSCFPSMATISARAGGVTKRQLARVFNGYTSDRYHPGLVERGYVEILVRAPRSNVYTLRFDRWGSRKTPDIDDTPPTMSHPDTDDRVTPTPVSPSIKGREQDHRNNKTPPTPPHSGGARLTREDRDQIKRARRRTRDIIESHELCEACGESLETDAQEVWLEDGVLSSWESPLEERQLEVAVPRGDLEARDADPDPEELAAFEDLIGQLRCEIGPTDMRHWIEPLELLRVRSSEVDVHVLELAAEDLSTAHWLRGNQLPPGNRYTLDGTIMTVRVGVIEHEWTELRAAGFHRSCAPEKED